MEMQRNAGKEKENREVYAEIQTHTTYHRRIEVEVKRKARCRYLGVDVESEGDGEVW